MLLNKEICKRCINERYSTPPLSWRDWDMEELYWESGKLYCGILNGMMVYVLSENVHENEIHKRVFAEYYKDTPPTNCPYFLEQTLYMEQQKK